MQLSLDKLFPVNGTIHIFLREYGTHTVKAHKATAYTVMVKTEQGEIHLISATNFVDRLHLWGDEGTLHKILSTSEIVKIHIIEKERPASTYNFTLKTFNKIGIAGSYNNVFKRLNK